MYAFNVAPKKTLHSRLWCWGTLVASSVCFLVLNLVALPDDIRFLYYLVGFLVPNSLLVVYLAERDYSVNGVTFDGKSFARGNVKIGVRDITRLMWQNGIFPQTDNGGCEITSRDSTITIRFQYLGDDDAIELIKRLREVVPIELQANWPEFCHNTGLRLFFQVHCPERALPEPTAEEADAQKMIAKHRGRAMLGLLLAGFLVACVLYAMLMWLGFGFNVSFGWSFGVFVFARIAAQVLAHRLFPSAKQSFARSLEIWDNEVMAADFVPTLARNDAEQSDGRGAADSAFSNG